MIWLSSLCRTVIIGKKSGSLTRLSLGKSPMRESLSAPDAFSGSSVFLPGASGSIRVLRHGLPMTARRSGISSGHTGRSEGVNQGRSSASPRMGV